MARCNAWYGEPGPESVWYRCELPKGHVDKHYYAGGRLEVYWTEDNRPRQIAFNLYFEAACIGYAYKFSLKRKQQMIALANKIMPDRRYPFRLKEEMLPEEQRKEYK